MPDHAKDRAIDALAQRQHGAFSTKQTNRLGFSSKERRSRLRSGRWVRLRNSSVFAVASAPRTWERQCVAATLSVPAGALHGTTAAALFGYPDHRRAGIELTTRHGTTHRSPFGKVHESRTVGRMITFQDVRTVSHADALVQVAPSYDVEGFGRLLDDVLLSRKRTLEELHDLTASLLGSRLPHLTTVKEVLAERAPGYAPPTSELNARFHRWLSGLPLPLVELEATPPWMAAGSQLVDALIPAWMVIVEADGRDYHTRVADFERDRERDAMAVVHGYAPLRFTWHQLTERTRWCRNVLLATGARRARLATLGALDDPAIDDATLAGAVLLG